jgi:hypothetical protein
VLGFQLRGDRLRLCPVVPDEWQGFEITYRHRSATYEFAVVRRADGNAAGVEVEEDGRKLEGGWIGLADDGMTHRVTVRIPKRMASSMVPPGGAVNRAVSQHATNGASPAHSVPTQVML